MDLQDLGTSEFEAELDRRIARTEAAMRALQQEFGLGLTGGSLRPVKMSEYQRLWREMDEAEEELKPMWAELARRRDDG